MLADFQGHPAVPTSQEARCRRHVLTGPGSRWCQGTRTALTVPLPCGPLTVTSWGRVSCARSRRGSSVCCVCSAFSGHSQPFGVLFGVLGRLLVPRGTRSTASITSASRAGRSVLVFARSSHCWRSVRSSCRGRNALTLSAARVSAASAACANTWKSPSIAGTATSLDRRSRPSSSADYGLKRPRCRCGLRRFDHDVALVALILKPSWVGCGSPAGTRPVTRDPGGGVRVGDDAPFDLACRLLRPDEDDPERAAAFVVRPPGYGAPPAAVRVPSAPGHGSAQYRIPEMPAGHQVVRPAASPRSGGPCRSSAPGSCWSLLYCPPATNRQRRAVVADPPQPHRAVATARNRHRPVAEQVPEPDYAIVATCDHHRVVTELPDRHRDLPDPSGTSGLAGAVRRREITTDGQQVTVIDLHNLPERAQRRGAQCPSRSARGQAELDTRGLRPGRRNRP